MRNDISNIYRTSFAVTALTLLAACATTDEASDSPPEAMPASSAEAAPAPDAPAAEGAVQLQANAPLKYVVQKGDTLWDISQKFLKDSWQWPELWYVNENVKNPHLIYPGDVLYLFWTDGQPRLARTEDTPAVYTGPQDSLSPRIRESALRDSIASIPLDAIRGFLKGPRIVSKDELEDAPYVLDFEDEHIMAAAESMVYVLDLEDPRITNYQIVRKGQKYIDPDDGDVIGYEAIPVGDAEVRVFGDPATVFLKHSDIETRPGDRLLPADPFELDARFVPHAPAQAVGGTIISVFNGDTQIGQYQIVAINRGSQQGIENGHVLTILQAGRKAKDPYSAFGSKVRLPDIKAGTVLVFKTTPRVSLALVMVALRSIHLGDKVEKPEPSAP